MKSTSDFETPEFSIIFHENDSFFGELPNPAIELIYETIKSNRPIITIVKVKSGIYLFPQYLPNNVDFYRDILSQIDPIDRIPFLLGFWSSEMQPLWSHPVTKFCIFISRSLAFSCISGAGFFLFSGTVGPLLNTVFQELHKSDLYTQLNDALAKSLGGQTTKERLAIQQAEFEQKLLEQEAVQRSRYLKNMIYSSLISYGVHYVAGSAVPGVGFFVGAALSYFGLRRGTPSGSNEPTPMPGTEGFAQGPEPVISVRLPENTIITLPPGWPTR